MVGTRPTLGYWYVDDAPAASILMTRSERQPLRLRFLGSLIEQLGAQLYPGATATMAELISNAWDADARNVWIDIPLGQPWAEDDRIVVTDDGIGMSYEDAETRYLLVGRKRRVELEQDSYGRRKAAARAQGHRQARSLRHGEDTGMSHSRHRRAGHELPPRL